MLWLILGRQKMATFLTVILFQMNTVLGMFTAVAIHAFLDALSRDNLHLAHRPSSAAHCERIVELSAGVVVSG